MIDMFYRRENDDKFSRAKAQLIDAPDEDIREAISDFTNANQIVKLAKFTLATPGYTHYKAAQEIEERRTIERMDSYCLNLLAEQKVGRFTPTRTIGRVLAANEILYAREQETTN